MKASAYTLMIVLHLHLLDASLFAAIYWIQLSGRGCCQCRDFPAHACWHCHLFPVKQCQGRMERMNMPLLCCHAIVI
ncbi:hypothetical protein BX070DRAFT_228348 [Coemansia spiralis]|nr:hypothetical protein BX070DRAFT_228348 [Coemansia spiralis]